MKEMDIIEARLILNLKLREELTEDQVKSACKRICEINAPEEGGSALIVNKAIQACKCLLESLD